MEAKVIKLKPWIKLPSAWIERRGLREFRWAQNRGSDNLAALMALAPISHNVDNDGIAKLSYDQLCTVTWLSRAKLSAGLQVLADRGIIERNVAGRSTFRLAGYNPHLGWAQFPAAGLYRDGTIFAFEHMRLRHRSELDALKLYYLFASRRDRASNVALISYDKIEDYSGVHRNSIRAALSWLAAQGLVHIDRVPSSANEDGVASAYRLAHLDTRRHMGTTGRSSVTWLGPVPAHIAQAPSATLNADLVFPPPNGDTIKSRP